MSLLPKENLVPIPSSSQANRNSRNSENSQALGCDQGKFEWPEADELPAIGEHKEYPITAFPDDVAKAILEVTTHGKMPTAIAAGSALSAMSVASLRVTSYQIQDAICPRGFDDVQFII